MDPAFWPSRMTAEKWRGNPKAPLKALEEREYNKRIYVGNLSDDITEMQIAENMKKVYRAEIANGTVKDIKAHINLAGLERAKVYHAQNPSQPLLKSACVVVTLHQGKDPEDLGLNLNEYKYDVRKTVRWWRGPTPLPREAPEINLEW